MVLKIKMTPLNSLDPVREQTSSNNTITFNEVLEGIYTVLITRDGYQPYTINNFDASSSMTITVNDMIAIVEIPEPDGTWINKVIPLINPVGTKAHYSINDYKTINNTWADAMEMAFEDGWNNVRSVTSISIVADERNMTFAAYPLIVAEPGEYVLDRTVKIGRNANFDFTGSIFKAPADKIHQFDAFDIDDNSHYNHYKLPWFHDFRRAVVLSTQNLDASILIEGGGVRNCLGGIDTVNYPSSRSTTLAIRDFETIGTNQALRVHEDHVLVEHCIFEHTGWDGSLIFNQGSSQFRHCLFKAKPATGTKVKRGLIEGWTTSLTTQLINPAFGDIENNDPVGVYLKPDEPSINKQPNRHPVGQIDRGVSIVNCDVEGDIPVLVWEGEYWKNTNSSNLGHNNVELKDINITGNSTEPLILINRDLPATVYIENVKGLNNVNTNKYIKFSPLSTDTSYNQHEGENINNVDGNSGINEHHGAKTWLYQIYFGEGNVPSASNISNDSEVNKYVMTNYREGSPTSKLTAEPIIDFWSVRESRSNNAINAVDYKTGANNWAQAINAAITEAAKASRGLVTISPGRYVIPEQINVPANVDLNFEGSIFMSTADGKVRQSRICIKATVRNNYHQLPGIIGFDKAFEYSFNTQSGKLWVDRGHFYNNRLDILDTGFPENRYGDVRLDSLRSTAQETHITTNARNTVILNNYAYTGTRNTPYIISNSRTYFNNFVGVPYPCRTTDFDKVAWFALYNDGVGQTAAEKNRKGIHIESCRFGGELGSRLTVRSYMDKTQGNGTSGALNNFIIIEYSMVELGSETGVSVFAKPAQIASAVAIEKDLPSYIRFRSLNGMTMLLDGLIKMQPGSSDKHKQLSVKAGDYIIDVNNTAEMMRPTSPATGSPINKISNDKDVRAWVYQPIAMGEDIPHSIATRDGIIDGRMYITLWETDKVYRRIVSDNITRAWGVEPERVPITKEMRYIRYNVMNAGNAALNREFKVMSGGNNVASGKLFTKIGSGTILDNPNYMTDGSLTTYSKYGGTREGMQIDLGQVYVVDQIIIQNFLTFDYSNEIVETSKDGTNWQTVYLRREALRAVADGITINIGE